MPSPAAQVCCLENHSWEVARFQTEQREAVPSCHSTSTWRKSPGTKNSSKAVAARELQQILLTYSRQSGINITSASQRHVVALGDKDGAPQPLSGVSSPPLKEGSQKPLLKVQV